MTALRRIAIVSLLTLASVAAVVTPASAPAAAEPSDTVWLCRPGLADNPCEPDLTTTRYYSSGEVLGVRRVRPAKRPPIDCFYVYPTVSDQPTPQADRTIDAVLRSIALYQAARYSSECRVFAPVYRQLTLAGITGAPVTPEMRETAYQDVRNAWLDYLERDNHGRGVVFVGHSQGTIALRRLLREEVDPNPAVRGKLVSALLLGGNVTVKKGQDRGGDFQNIGACRSDHQLGCVVAFSTFNQPVPASSRFGRTADPSLEVLCVNPSQLEGGLGSLDPIFPTQPFAPGVINSVRGLLGIPAPTAPTPFVEYRSAYLARCSSENGANVLQITPRGNSPAIRPTPDPSWGLHLVDANIALRDLVDIVHEQSEEWLRTHSGGRRR